MELGIGLLALIGAVALLRSLFMRPQPPVIYTVAVAPETRRRVPLLPILIFLALAALVISNTLNR